MINPRLYRELDSSLFKAFLYAAHELNFTNAARKAGMTQSGVSQKISKLEEQIGHRLFDRINKRISLTESGLAFLDFIERQQDDLDGLFEKLGVEQKIIGGPVRYAMPHSCLFTPHFPMILKAREKFSEVSFKVTLCSNEDVTDLLLKREIDFGFLTRKNENPAFDLYTFAVEEYVIVGRPALIKSLKPSPANVSDLPFVNYPGMKNLFEILKQNVGAKGRAMSFDALSFVGEINNLHAAVTMLIHGVGLSVIPKHVVANELKSGALEISRGFPQFKNEIYIARLSGVREPARVRAVIDAFKAMK